MTERARAATRHWDAIIVGTGFGGSMTALKLARAGKSVLVIDRGRRSQAPPEVMEILERAAKVTSKVDRMRQMLPTLYSAQFLAQQEENYC